MMRMQRKVKRVHTRMLEKLREMSLAKGPKVRVILKEKKKRMRVEAR